MFYYGPVALVFSSWLAESLKTSRSASMVSDIWVVCFFGSDWHEFVSVRCEVNTWTNDESIQWHIDASSVLNLLTHLPLDKMAAILADDNFKCIFFNENYRIMIQISLKYVPRSPIDNKSALVQVMVWRRSGDKPLPEPMLTQFIEA